MSEAFDPYRKWLGIPPNQQPPHHYRLLAIELFESDPDAIANAADRQMAHIRTFQAGPHSALSQKLLNELSAARVCLLNPERKEAYDAALQAQLAASQPALAPAPLPAVSAPAPRAMPVPIAAPAPRPLAADPLMNSASVKAVAATSGRRRAAWMAPAVAAISLAGLGVAAYLGAHFFSGAGGQEQQISTIAERAEQEPVNRQAPPPNESPQQVVERSKSVAAGGASETATPAQPEPPVRETPKVNAEAPNSPPPQPANRSGDAPRIASSPPAGAMPQQQSPPPANNVQPPFMPTPGPAPFSRGFRLPPPEPVALLAGQIDVLKEINLPRDVVAGEWRQDGEGLVSPPAGLSRLKIAVPPGDEYVLVVDVERLSGAGGFGVGLSAGDAHAVMWFDGQGAEATGLDGANSNVSNIGRRMPLLGTIRLAYGVRKSGAVLLQPGQGAGISWSSLVQWKGDFAEWKWPAGWTPPEKGRLELISSDAGFRIRRMVLARADGWEVDDPNVVRMAKGVPAFMRNQRSARMFGRSPMEPAQKLSPPEAAELAAARQQVAAQHQARYASAEKPADRLNLARSVLSEARNSGRPPADRYALFDYARGIAAEVGGAAMAFEAVGEMAARFEIDELALKLDTLEAAAKAPPTPQGKVEQIAAGLELTEACTNADRIVDGNRALGIAQSAARAIKDAGLTKQVNERKREIDKIAKAHLAVKNDLERLKTAPDDPAANLAVGKYLCLTRQKWDEGLKHLAAGGDDALAELGRRELANPSIPEEQFRLAEDWRKLAEQESGTLKAPLDERAKHWYRKAAPFLAGDAKQTAEKHLALAGDAVDESKVRYLSEMPEIDSKASNNFFFKARSFGEEPIKVKGIESPHGLFMQPRRKDFAGVTYDLERKSRRFKAEVGIDDSAKGGPASPLVFEVWGDGKLMWQSSAVVAKGPLQACDLNVSRIKLLHLRVNCAGDNDSAHCVWIEPRLTLK